ncbi:MAG: TonB-dependent receptor, partial [Cellvibrionales bacterium]
MTRSITTRAVLAVALTVPYFCHAADSSEGDSALEETVVVASRVPTPLNRLGVSVSVTDRESLELLGYSNIGDFLDLQPGVSVTRDGGPGKAAAVRIRGEEGFRTRIILDGIDIADPSSPQVSPRIEHLLSEGLQRIEVLRGPQGLAFGADAGGVISATTRQTVSGLAASIAAEGGEDSFSRLGAFVAGGNDRISGSLSVTDLSTDGFNARVSDAAGADRDGYDNTTTHATASYALTDSWSVQGSLHHIDGNNEYDGCFDSVTFAVINDCNDDYLQSAWRVALNYEQDRISSSLSYERSSTERDFFSAGVPAFSSEGDREEISWLGAVSIKEGHRIALGVDASEMSIVDGDSKPSRDNLGVWGEYGLDFGRGSITAGARFDDNDDFGQHTSGRVSLHQTLLDGPRPLAIKAAIGTGFRAPSPFEIVYNNGPFSFPASETEPLREETSEGWEVGIQWGELGQSVELTWFDQKIED